jgi:TusA-related sulfurtransferase
MEWRPPWNPYDAIVALDQKCDLQDGQILELAKSQNAQSRQIQALIKNQNEIRQELLDLREQLAKTMQLQIDALHKINQAKNFDNTPQ